MSRWDNHNSIKRYLMKRVLVLCTGNSCRSIICEALINKYLDEVKAYSAGTKPVGKINENAKKILIAENAWNETYYSKHLDEIIDMDFDLVVTVCDSAKETCPVFPKAVTKIHIGFSDPDGKDYEEFEKLVGNIKKEFLPKIKEKFN